MSGKRLVVKNIRYGRILRDVSFEVAQGEKVALLGRNGAGKSTLARIIAGLENASGGETQLWQGKERLDWSCQERWRMVGLVRQHPRRQTIGATVREELGFGLLNLGLPEPQIRSKVQEMLIALGLADQADQSPATLSGGERQRLVVAAFLLIQPAFLILDEALSMLDRHSEERIFNLLNESACEAGQIWITHDWRLAAQADRVLSMEDGVLSEVNNLKEYAHAVLGMKHHQKSKQDMKTEIELKPESKRKPKSEHKADFKSESEPQPQLQPQPLLEWVDAVYNDRVQIHQKVFPGDFIGILGPSGAGKSTILESVMGLVKANEGELILLGDAAGKKNRRFIWKRNKQGSSQDWGAVLQEAGEYLIGGTVFHEVFYGIDRRNRKLLKEQYPGIFTENGLPLAWATLPPECLSGGERQKVALAAAIWKQPPVLLLDEPLLGLDRKNKSEISAMIGCLKNVTVLYAAHDLQEILPWANRLWLVEKGKRVVEYSASDWQNYREDFARAGVRF